MFQVFSLLAILSAAGPSSIAAAGEEPVVVFQCDFGATADANYDRWPDGWTRRTGRDYPAYVRFEVEADSAGERSLRIDLDGGAATAYSPAVPVSPRFNYVLQGRIKTLHLKHDVAGISFTFYDAERKPIGETHYSADMRDAPDWRDVRIEMETPDDPRIAWGVIGVHLRPGSAGADLTGSAQFDDVALARVPRMQLRGGKPFHLFDNPAEVSLNCVLSGVAQQEARLRMELLDVDGRALAAEELLVKGNLIGGAAPSTAASTGAATSGVAQPTNGVVVDLPPAYASETTWRPVVPDYGFYRVRVTLSGAGQGSLARETTLAVVRPVGRAASGPFGWSLAEGSETVSLDQLTTLLLRAEVHAVKYPLWRKETEGAWPEQFARFCERLSTAGVAVVAVLDQPPDEIRARLPGAGRLPTAALFVEPETWAEAIDAVAERFSLKVSWWQLGADHDTSFVGLQKLPESLAGVRAKMQRFGQQVRLGFAAEWNSAPAPEAAAPGAEKRRPWAFLAWIDDPALSPDDLQSHLAAVAENGVERWLTLRIPPAGEQEIETRARKLVERMLAARIAGAERIFLAEPLHYEHGLVDTQGLPRELLLPWRTTAAYLSGTEYLGSLTLPQGSRNHVFARGNEAMMVVWNERPTMETLYLGEQVEMVDVWGRGTQLSRDGDRQIVPVGPTPTFLLGVSLPVARWSTAFQFDSDRLASVFGRRQSTGLGFQNTFEQPVSGRVELHVPEVWQIDPRQLPFKLEAGGQQKTTLDVVLGPDASSGPQPVRLDFEIEADRTYRFSVFRTLHVGLGDVDVELATQLDERGSLVVKQRLKNNTDREVSFNCMLFAPGRRRERVQVLRQGKGEQTGTFVLERGEELIGQTLWLRAEEIGGDRVLNYSIVAEK